MKNKKDLLGGVIIVVLLLLVLVTYMSFYNYDKMKDTNINTDEIKDNSLYMINVYGDYSTLKIEDKNSINNGKIVLGTYNCKSDDCEVYDHDGILNVYDDKYIILKENNKIFVYDFTLKKVVSEMYDDISYQLNDTYYLVSVNNKYGVISKSGVKVIESVFDEIVYDEVYDSYIKVKNKGLYGIVDLDNGNIVVATKYEDIKFADTKYYSVLQDGLWYAVDENGNTVSKGYNYVFAFNKGFIALIDNNLQILKYNKEQDELLNSSVISVYSENGFEIKRDASNILIEVKNGDSISKYEYSINRNKLLVK